MTGALDGIRILDMTRVLAGPYSTMILGDLGADVIKVEAPGGSDDTRFWGPPFQNGVSAYYISANRNKRSITVNLKTEEGKEVIRRLAKTVDVVIHNFKTGTMEKFGLDYNALSSLNPQLIYCSITGFGETGPYRHLPGYDYIIQAMSGWMSITGTESSGPLKVGVAITDVFTGLYAAIAVQAALLAREKTGRGQKIDLSLFDSAISTLVNVASNYLMSGEVPKRLGNDHPNIVPYSTYEASDGLLVIAVGNDRQFQSLCELLSDPTIGKDPRFQTNPGRVAYRDELNQRLNEEIKKRTKAEWQQLLAEKGVPCGPVNTLDQLFQDPQTLAREMVVTMEHPKVGTLKLVGSPLKMSDTKVSYRIPPPLAGEHNDEILKEIGLISTFTNEMEE
ncbi:crotonobetainyl-CoA:carnitine CoA-transferase CaiB-like acyl-CoA transferase [Thermolongibacillus altinsuensis]|uniref:Crotonobetainyl-CoA:carnitine CoA-transferase CaiB-like acyl-CoA transferase n=1 Tax=Thermolongibacillus altinsuensis TaxID=575256 RepID=A0A4V2QAP5_9BACL|nr:CoA transferase [Thermolongibacillus altinsuensis]TCL53272.1 crotonobetainyl-CoA:carnitine CoA-transferase CaiB-like acyl-CoA transferase [Thermolongibacillus altinsuensis]GMB07967.1 CoA transferase [Thermolongibacillus altinsuensis]